MTTNEIREQITAEIISQIESGCAAWQRPVSKKKLATLHPQNALSKKVYNGLNYISLLNQAIFKTYDCGYWATLKQFNELGGKINKGEKSSKILFWSSYDKKDEKGEVILNDKGEPEKAFCLKQYFVFNIAQTDLEIPQEPKREFNGNAKIDTLVKNYGIEIEKNNSYMVKASGGYCPTTHTIAMGDKSFYQSESVYYSTLLHELGHSTAKALGREISTDKYTKEYAFEELVAELTSLFLSAELGADFNPQNTAAYVESWALLLQERETSILKASKLAQQACDYLLSFLEQKEQEVA